MRCCLLSLLLVAACNDGGTTSAGGLLDPQPGQAPDVVLLSVSGHDGALSGILCTSDTNRTYLADQGEAVDAVVQAIEDLGLTVEVAHFADRLAAPAGQPNNYEQVGFEEMLATMQKVYDVWMSGAANPPKLVIVAHSHGATWAHIATSVMDQIPVSCLITLDGICFAWECEHADEVTSWEAGSPLTLSWDIAYPCDVWPIAGLSTLYNTKDVVFDNVLMNLEVQSSDPFVADCCDNLRLDGSSDGIATYASAEWHNEVRLSSSAAMMWVGDMIRLHGLP